MSDASFVEQCLQGEATLDDIEDFVEAWHQSDDERELHEYLGLTWEEYALSVERPQALRFVLFSKRFGVPLDRALAEYPVEREPVVARARSEAEAREVLEWLKKTGRLKD
jgi:hypothetical protein